MAAAIITPSPIWIFPVILTTGGTTQAGAGTTLREPDVQVRAIERIVREQKPKEDKAWFYGTGKAFKKI
ncbi:uncharacterized protein DFL_005143 [Arthrobotrys flagrans]|uniref:Uncharacterized protein n=1 Tax=Arthrobotrys flagrans TaxID=97331 RepID=A0A437A7F1_ARTFL|nr:hypothetical protein DFL_005143 [Arthrobotrys flagrans]